MMLIRTSTFFSVSVLVIVGKEPRNFVIVG